jgi:glucokinase
VAESYFLGVDLGGTQVRVAAVTRSGTLASDVLSARTGAEFAPDDLRRALRELGGQVARRMNGARAEAVGFGTAGVVGAGPLTQSPHLPRIEGTDVAALVAETMGSPVAVENDARCFTLAEARYGAGRGAKDVCGIVIGTGVGCGVMIGGRLHRGANAQAGEVWHIPLRGDSVERFVAGAGVVRGYEAAGGAPEAEALDAARVAARARAGDRAAVAAWRSFGEDLGFLCRSVIALVDPAVIVIGGSLAQAADLYRPALLARLDGHPTRIAEAELGAAAGVIGAAALNID